MKLKAQAGLTLLEVLASIVILGIILTIFFGFFSQSLLFSSKNEEDLQAINQARKVLVLTQSLNNVDFLTDESNELPSELNLKIEQGSQAYYIEDENNNKYYVEINNITENLTNSDEMINLSLIPISVSVCNDSPCSDETLLSETFGYVKDETNGK